MSSPRRVQRSRTTGARKPPDAVTVARPTVWGNPWPASIHRTRTRAVDLYRAYIEGRAADIPIDDWTEADPFARLSLTYAVRHRIGDLAGHDLACWCPLGQPCHADVLLELANPADPQGGESSG